MYSGYPETHYPTLWAVRRLGQAGGLASLTQLWGLGPAVQVAVPGEA